MSTCVNRSNNVEQEITFFTSEAYTNTAPDRLEAPLRIHKMLALANVSEPYCC